MSDETQVIDSSIPTRQQTPAKPKVPLTDDQKKARKAAKKELRAMHAVNRQDPKHDPKTFDDERFHALHYLAVGKAVPSIDPDDQE